ncbi:MAG: membrane protease regulatory membrane protein [Bacillota bacterium]|nr:MAG: membrane protease regulatory membrane protein [Bacillota bacterium]MBS3949322.1 NfeD family protein [Peptococcaceae bacterium]
MSAWLTWAILGLALIGFEMITPSFFIIWFGVGALAAALVAKLGFSLVWQLTAFLVCTVTLLAYTRKFAVKVQGGHDTKTGYTALVGKIAIVTKRISAHTGIGLVKVLGEEWSAIAETERNIGPGEKVVVVAVTGVRLIVRPLKDSIEIKEE